MKPNDKEHYIYHGIPLWVYTPQTKMGGGWAYGNRTACNIHVVWGVPELLRTIRGKKVASCLVAEKVPMGWYNRYVNAKGEAVRVVRDFDLFLYKAIGTSNKNSAEYKELMKKAELHKAEAMQVIMEGANGN